MPTLAALLSAVLAIQDPPPAPARTPLDDASILARRGLVAASRGDPAIAAVQSAAARCSDPAAADGGATARSRAAALLPRVTAEVRLDDRSYRVFGLQGSGEVDYTRRAPGWTAALQATWDLGALVSPPAERATEKGVFDRARRHDEAIRRATSLYYERRRLRLGLELTPPTQPGERAATQLEIERLAAELDALTCGAFTGAAR